MAKYSATSAVHKTLTATTADSVTLANVSSGTGVSTPSITVVNRSGTHEIYFTLSTTGTDPAEPTVGGNDAFVVPAAITSVRVPASISVVGHSAVVKLISTGAEAYSVQAL